MDPRKEFLIEMYRQTSNHLNRHIQASWQFMTILLSAFAVVAVVEKPVIIDFACAIVIVLCSWLCATAIDGSSWFNRNITIVTNIERQFLLRGDLVDIHPFFLQHRKPGSVIMYFQIQLVLAASLGILILVYHFYKQVWPGMIGTGYVFDSVRCLPYISTALCTLWCRIIWNKHMDDDKHLQVASPGIPVK